MRLRNLFAFMSLALATIGSVLARAVSFAIDAVAKTVEPFSLTNCQGLAPSMPSGDQIDAASFQHSRHEAGVRRRSADRNI